MSQRHEKVYVLAAFGDITGFRRYTRRITDPIQRSHFLKRFDDLIEKFEERNDFFFKDLSDGFLCITKLKGKNGSWAVLFLNELWDVCQDVQRLIDAQKYPRPDGFRVRMAAGHVMQKIRKNGAIDFRGEHIDLAATLLQIEKQIPFILHESAKQLISEVEAERAGFSFEHLPNPKVRRCEECIYKEELGALWAFNKK